MQLKKYITSKNEVLLYIGEPKTSLLENLANGTGDLWHSSLDQGFADCFQDIVYQTAVYWWFLNEIKNLDFMSFINSVDLFVWKKPSINQK